MKNGSIFAPAISKQKCSMKAKKGTLAQLVEQRTENPCVPGSIPGGTTANPLNEWVFCFLLFTKNIKTAKAVFNILFIRYPFGYFLFQ